MAPKAYPNKDSHDALLPLLDKRVVRRITESASGPQASHEVYRLWLQAVFASMAVSNGNSALRQQILRLSEELSQECLMVEVLEQEIRGLHFQATTTSSLGNLPRRHMI
ncbi:hypothetical protein LIER_40865 [Lithospermum erythrorhizon]|uniref:Uncharacterized protein n=1 Tax=Lithospermum erythrorhizon TaxID=34254 RepID=A0AAV3R6L3_LITER